MSNSSILRLSIEKIIKSLKQYYDVNERIMADLFLWPIKNLLSWLMIKIELYSLNQLLFLIVTHFFSNNNF